MLQELAGRKEDARTTWTRARDYFEPLMKAQPDNGELVGPMAFILALLDQRDEAFKALERFNSFTVGDARTAGTLEEVRARICARLGDKECAITSLERLLFAPSDGIFGAPVTRATLKLDPMFDPLRGDPRFEKLCQEPAK
jgi:predicted Zn-dependent protease